MSNDGYTCPSIPIGIAVVVTDLMESPDLAGALRGGENHADPHLPNQKHALAPPSPPWSIATIKSLDISSNIPNIALAMDAEDSPWGGKLFHPQ